MVSISRGSSFLKIITISLIVIYFASLVRGTTGFRATQPSDDPSKDSFGTAFLNRTSFPAGFVFGTGSSAYQFEGAANESGRAPSIWDTFVHKYPGKVTDGSNGDVAVDSYHRYKEDVGIMKEMGMDAYRFSISWSRILPKGKISGGVNKEGIEYYNNLISELHANGIKPFVTLFHWDLPQALEDEHGGFLTHHVVKHFEAYAELCYKEFGDRVKHWITFNEPIAFAVAGYDLGVLAPGRCSTWISPNCTGGNSTTEPYLVTHYQLLAHAAAANSYKNHYQKSQKGEIGITLAAEWLVPNNTEAQQDKAAQLRALDFTLGWYMDPLTTGDYPKSMRSLVGDRLPKFKKEQSKLLKGSFDFIGFNYYTSTYVSDAPELKSVVNQSFMTDYLATMSPLRNGVPIGPEAATEGLYIYPSGIRDILLYTKKKYNNPIIYITENGVDEFNDPKLTLQEALADDQRIDYHFRHLYYLRASIKDGVNVKGYFAWSLLDNFEWTLGYTVRYGINYVDYKDGLKRYPKHSALWFKNFLKKYQHTDDGGTVRRPAPYGVAQL